MFATPTPAAAAAAATVFPGTAEARVVSTGYNTLGGISSCTSAGGRQGVALGSAGVGGKGQPNLTWDDHVQQHL